MLVARRRREVDHAGADRRIGEAVDQDEAADVAVVRIGVEGDRLVEAKIAEADLVQRQRAWPARCSSVLMLIRCLMLGDRGRHRARRRSSADRGGPAAAARPPSRRCAPRTGRPPRRRAGAHSTSPRRDVDLVGERQRHGSPGLGPVEIAVHGDDARHLGWRARTAATAMRSPGCDACRRRWCRKSRGNRDSGG